SYVDAIWILSGKLATVLIPLPPNFVLHLRLIGRQRTGRLPEVRPQPVFLDDRGLAENSCGPGTHWQTPAAERGVLLPRPARENADRTTHCHQTVRSSRRAYTSRRRRKSQAGAWYRSARRQKAAGCGWSAWRQSSAYLCAR